MKRKLFVLAGIIAFISAAVFAKENVMTVDTKDCSVSVPEGWSAMNSFRIVKGTSVLCLLAPEKQGEAFQSNCNITSGVVNKNVTEKASLQAGKEQLEILFPNFKMLEEGKNYHIYTATINGLNVKQVQFIKIKDNKSYIITGTSPVESFDSYYSEYKNIFKSFKIKSSAISDDSIELSTSDCSVRLPVEWLGQYTNSSSIFNFASPADSKTGVCSSVSLLKETLDKAYTTGEYLDILESYYSSSVKNFNLVDRGEYFHVYTASNSDGADIKEVQFVKSNKKKTYFLFTCTAIEDNYDSFADTFAKIAESLTIK